MSATIRAWCLVGAHVVLADLDSGGWAIFWATMGVLWAIVAAVETAAGIYRLRGGS